MDNQFQSIQPDLGGQGEQMPEMAGNEPIQPQEMVQPNMSPVNDGNPYFMGDYALIKFSSGEEGYGSETYWLVDKSNNTIRPFESENALSAVFGEEVQNAIQNVMIVTPPVIDSSGNITEGVLTDFTILGPEYSIKEDGTSKPLDFSPKQLSNRYGKPIDENAENKGAEVLDGFLEKLKENEAKTSIPASFLDKLKQNEQLMAFYISAAVYGGYTLSDIFEDISRRYKDENGL